MRHLNEALDYHDMKNEVEPVVTVDEYSAKMGKDKDLVTLTFIVGSEKCGEDLVSWFETGYDFVKDAAVSDGELDNGKWLVFVELQRRLSVPERIVELLSDLKTLTALDLEDYKIKVNDNTYQADKEILKQVIELSPREYARAKRKEDKEDELNQMRDIANLERPDVEAEPSVPDAELDNMKSAAGL